MLIKKEKYIRLKLVYLRIKIKTFRPCKKLIGKAIQYLIRLSPLTSIVVSLVVAFFAYWLAVPADFVITIDNNNIGKEIDANLFFFAHCDLTIKDTPMPPSFLSLKDIALKHYPYSVFLEANYFIDGTPIPKNLSARFTPQGNATLPFKSSVNFSCPGLPSGDHVIKISAHGGDGKEKCCYFLLKSRPRVV